MKTIPLVSAVSALLLAGCATSSTKDAAKLDLSRNGLVLVTWTPGNSKSERMNSTYAEVHLRRLSSEGIALDDKVIKSTQPLSLLELSPGRYRVAECRLVTAPPGEGLIPGVLRLGGRLGRPAEGTVFEFEVRPGEVTYVGDLHPLIETAVHTDHYSYRASLFLRDMYGKTIAAFREEYPALSKAPTRDAAPRLLAWDLLPPVEKGFAKAVSAGPRGGGLANILYFQPGGDTKAGDPLP